MQRLSPEAAHVFLETTKRSFFFGLIGWTQVIGRLQALRELCAPSDPIRMHAERVLLCEYRASDNYEKDSEDDWAMGESPKLEGSKYSEQSSFTYEGGSYSTDDDNNSYLYFLPGSQTGLTYWQFHLYDDDHFPSIPHGHHKKDRRQKLDSYLGWVYQRTRQIDREPRRKIIALWNDSKFRAAALISIEYYIEHHPHHMWRVQNPRQLPRRR